MNAKHEFSLFLDSTGNNLIIGLINLNNQIIDFHSRKLNKNLTEYFVADIQTILKKNKIDKTAITKLYLVHGPGTFSGIRSSSLVAKTWCQIMDHCELFVLDKFTFLSQTNSLVLVMINKKDYFIKIYDNSNKHSVLMLDENQFKKTVTKHPELKLITEESIDYKINIVDKIKLFQKIDYENLKLEYLKQPC